MWTSYLCAVQVAYPLMYTVGANKIQRPSGTRGGSNKKQVEQKVGDGTESKSDDESKRNDYVKALRDLKLEWFKWVPAKYNPKPL